MFSLQNHCSISHHTMPSTLRTFSVMVLNEQQRVRRCDEAAGRRTWTELLERVDMLITIYNYKWKFNVVFIELCNSKLIIEVLFEPHYTNVQLFIPTVTNNI